ncbi:MAG: metalloregulator ArsR/SmtB family transcription factor [Cytophagales bacterium]|nr:metalloregulator ArsR/SmtB family transcription factor [Cytophagales bacterium]
MVTQTSSNSAEDQQNAARVFQVTAELFSVLSTPIRLQILSALCDNDLSVSQILERVETTQPNLSQHLAILYRHGVIGKRKDGTQVIYSVESERAAMLCRAVVTQVAIELADPQSVHAGDRLLTRQFA